MNVLISLLLIMVFPTGSCGFGLQSYFTTSQGYGGGYGSYGIYDDVFENYLSNINTGAGGIPSATFGGNQKVSDDQYGGYLAGLYHSFDDQGEGGFMTHSPSLSSGAGRWNGHSGNGYFGGVDYGDDDFYNSQLFWKNNGNTQAGLENALANYDLYGGLTLSDDLFWNFNSDLLGKGANTLPSYGYFGHGNAWGTSPSIHTGFGRTSHSMPWKQIKNVVPMLNAKFTGNGGRYGRSNLYRYPDDRNRWDEGANERKFKMANRGYRLNGKKIDDFAEKFKHTRGMKGNNKRNKVY